MNNDGIAKSIGQGVVSGLASGGGITGTVVGGINSLAKAPGEMQKRRDSIEKANARALKKQENADASKRADELRAGYDKYLKEYKEKRDVFKASGLNKPKRLTQAQWEEQENYKKMSPTEKRRVNIAKASKVRADKANQLKLKNQLSEMFGTDMSRAVNAKNTYYANLKDKIGGKPFARKDLDNPDSAIYKQLLRNYKRMK